MKKPKFKDHSLVKEAQGGFTVLELIIVVLVLILLVTVVATQC